MDLMLMMAIGAVAMLLGFLGFVLCFSLLGNNCIILSLIFLVILTTKS